MNYIHTYASTEVIGNELYSFKKKSICKAGYKFPLCPSCVNSNQDHAKKKSIDDPD